MTDEARRPPPRNIGPHLREARLAGLKTVAGLAEESGVSISTINKVESGERNLSPESIRKLGEVFGERWRIEALAIQQMHLAERGS